MKKEEVVKDITGAKIIEHFSKIKDPRVENKNLHSLMDIMVIGICSVICGATGWEDMEKYGKAKKEWLKGFLKLENGIPSEDTFRRVFSRIKPKEFEECFLSWINDVKEVTKGEVIAIDGKTLRRSFDRAGKKAAIHMVSAWAKANRLVLGQVKVDDKSNEITAIPKLLNMLELNGCIVTIDAMGCQKDIAATIIRRGANYVLALKGNQGNFYESVNQFFETAEKKAFNGIKHSYYKTLDTQHGRIETRQYWVVSEIDFLIGKGKEEWENISSIIMVKSERVINGKAQIEIRYFISSLRVSARKLGQAIRGHWSIENGLHWILDVAFREDESRIRKDHGSENYAVLRHIALNLLKREKSKDSIRAKRLKAGWDDSYLLNVLCA